MQIPTNHSKLCFFLIYRTEEVCNSYNSCSHQLICSDYCAFGTIVFVFFGFLLSRKMIARYILISVGYWHNQAIEFHFALPVQKLKLQLLNMPSKVVGFFLGWYLKFMFLITNCHSIRTWTLTLIKIINFFQSL